MYSGGLRPIYAESFSATALRFCFIRQYKMLIDKNLNKAHRVIQESQVQKQQQHAKTVSAAAPKYDANVVGSTGRLRKSWILIAVIAALAVLIGLLIWIANGGAK